MLFFHPEDLRRVADAAGDTSLSKISARTRLAPSTVSRFLSGRRTPSLGSAQKIYTAYEPYLNVLDDSPGTRDAA